LFLDRVLGVRDGDGKRGRIGGPAGLSLDEPRNNSVELLLQGLEFGSLRDKSLVGEVNGANSRASDVGFMRGLAG
jgi:predicted sugar kinase